MSEWRIENLGSISIQIQTGPFGSQLHQSDYSDIGTPVIMPKDIVDGKISDDSIARVEEVHVNRLARHKVNEGDIIYPRRGDVRKCAYTTAIQSGWLCGTGCLRVTIDNKKAVPKYVFYHLQEEKTRGWIEKHAIGATMLNLNTSILSNIPLRIPRLDVQKKIATILSRYDSLIDNYQKQIKLLEEAAQRLYKEWFAQNNNLETIKLVDISSKITDGVHNTVYNEEGSPYKLLSCKNVVGDHLMISSSERSISKDTFEKLRKRTQLEKGDILVSTVGSVGEVVYLDIEPDHFEFQRSVGIIKADKNVITPLYVYYSLLNRKNELKRTAHGAAQQCLFISDLKNFEIPIGSKEQIQNFEHFAKPISERITNARHQLRLLTESRDRLLPKLLSGEIEV